MSYHSGWSGWVRYFTAADFTGGVVTNWGLVPQQFVTVYVPILVNNLTSLGVILGLAGGLALGMAPATVSRAEFEAALARIAKLEARIAQLEERVPLRGPGAKPALGELRQGRGTIMVSHRLASVAFADRIYVMEKGRIIEQGDHQGLMDLGGVYHTLFAEQALLAELEG